MTAGAQDAADLVESRVRVDQVLDDLAEQDGVGRLRPERQPAVGQFAADRVRDAGAGASEGVLGPVDADEAVAGEEGAAVAAAVPSPQPMSRMVRGPPVAAGPRAAASMRAWARLRGVPEATGTDGSS